MKEQIEEIRKEVKEMEEKLNEQDSTMVLLEKSLDNSNRRHNMVIRCLMTIIVILLAINGYFAYQFTTTTVMETTEQEGIYNYVDSDGNIISSDLSLEEMEQLIEMNE